MPRRCEIVSKKKEKIIWHALLQLNKADTNFPHEGRLKGGASPLAVSLGDPVSHDGTCSPASPAMTHVI